MASTCTRCLQWYTGTWEDHVDECPEMNEYELSVEDEFERDISGYDLDDDDKERIWNEDYRERAFDQSLRRRR